MMVQANEVVGHGFPTDEGARLARTLLQSDTEWSDLEVDLRRLPAGLLISAFFNAFLQEVFDRDHRLLKLAKQTRWIVQFDFQRENINGWMERFRPVDEA